MLNSYHSKQESHHLTYLLQVLSTHPPAFAREVWPRKILDNQTLLPRGVGISADTKRTNRCLAALFPPPVIQRQCGVRCFLSLEEAPPACTVNPLTATRDNQQRQCVKSYIITIYKKIRNEKILQFLPSSKIRCECRTIKGVSK